MTRFLTLDDAIDVVGWLGFHIRDAGLLASALSRPATSFAEEDVYPTLSGKAAALMESLARNHSLFDGNKRTAWMLTLHFLALNGFRHTLTTEEAFDLVVGVADGSIDLERAGTIIDAHLAPL